MDFSQFKKPWPKSVARARYVNGTRITLSALAQESGRSYEVIRRWSCEDNWTLERRRFQSLVNAQIQEKVAQILSDSLRDEVSSILKDQWESAHRGRILLDTRLDAELRAIELIQEQIESGEATEQDLLDHLRSLPARDLNALIQALRTAIETERESIGMSQFVNIELMIKALHDLGYAVLDGKEFQAMIADSEPDQLPQADITE